MLRTHYARKVVTFFTCFVLVLTPLIHTSAVAQSPRFSTGVPTVSDIVNNTLFVSLPIINSGTATAFDVQVTEIVLGSATRHQPTSLPIALNRIAAGVAADVNASFSANDLTVGSRLLMTVRGTYAIGGITQGFAVNRSITVPAPPKFFFFTEPSDPLLLRAEMGNGDVIEYFGEKDAEGFATALKTISRQTPNGNITTYFLDEQARPTQILAFNGLVFNIEWQSDTFIIITTVSPDGSIQVSTPIDLALAQASAISHAPLNITPRLPTDAIQGSAQQVCEQAASVFNISCQSISILSPYSSLICASIASAVALVPGGLALVPLIIAACPLTFAALELLCAANEIAESKGGQNLAAYLCQRLLSISNTPRAQLLSFVEGDPGTAGDGIFIDAMGGFPLVFELSSPFPLGGTTDGLTLSIYTHTPNLQFLSMNVISLRPPPCRTNLGTGGGFPTGRIMLNGVRGNFVNMPQSQIASIVEIANFSTPGCNFTADDLYISTVGITFAPGQFITILDAAAIGRGQNAIAGTRIP